MPRFLSALPKNRVGFTFAREIRWKSWWHLFSTGLVLGGAYFGIFYPESPMAVKLACSVLAGLTIARMFIIYHDHQHKDREQPGERAVQLR